MSENSKLYTQETLVKLNNIHFYTLIASIAFLAFPMIAHSTKQADTTPAPPLYAIAESIANYTTIEQYLNLASAILTGILFILYMFCIIRDTIIYQTSSKMPEDTEYLTEIELKKEVKRHIFNIIVYGAMFLFIVIRLVTHTI